MPVYVDGQKNSFGRMKMCHMSADTLDELHDMAKAIGLKRAWFQDERVPHYDLSLSKRKLAIEQGAVELNMFQMVEWIEDA